MQIRSILLLSTALILLLLVGVNEVHGENQVYTDEFNHTLDSWTQIGGSWYVSNGTVQATGGRPALIFEEWEGDRYVFKSKFSADDSKTENYSQTGFYFYYRNEENYSRIVFADRNSNDLEDMIIIEAKNVSITNKKMHISIADNKAFDFSPADFRYIKIVRLGRKIYVYLQDDLVYTAEFKDYSPRGGVGYDVFSSTGYFDEFYLRPISFNSSFYEDSVTLEEGSTLSLGKVYSLRLSEVAGEKALLSLERYGGRVDRTVTKYGDSTTLNDIDDEKYVEFSVDEVFDPAEGRGKVWIRDVFSREIEVDKVSFLDFKVEDNVLENSAMNFSAILMNTGNSSLEGTVNISFSVGGSSFENILDVDLGPGEAMPLKGSVTAPRTYGTHNAKLRAVLHGQAHSLTQKVQVITKEPPLKELKVTADSGTGFTAEAVPSISEELVDWKLPYSLKVYRLSASGKREVHTEDGFFNSRGSEFNLEKVVRGGQENSSYYEAVLKAGGRTTVHILNVAGREGNEDASAENGGDAKIKKNDIGDNRATKLLLLTLLGLVTVNSVKMRRYGHRNVPVEGVLVGGGALTIVVLFFFGENVLAGLAVLLAGVFFAVSRRFDPRLSSICSKNDVLMDYLALLAVFTVAGAILINTGGMWVAVAAPLLYGTTVSMWIRLDRR